ncbi:hypothetical protein JMN32_06120 [Fulvivirga sp. 29W222]|uniref:Peptidase M56 domain-containing protein n=1 Tax=Fulvivirga marina TaxID=2494733 RepID=A0A937FTZ1_9BACT|nr:M56 family metallopeptidase [Fulvivirga marina]MBL6445874.1 hypothetical protein [Fulvivirga marina]
MIKTIMYFLESGAVLAFFYLLYVLVLRRETFFNLNRFFLLGILVFSIVVPWMSFDFNPAGVQLLEQQVQEISKFRTSYYDAMAKWEFENFGERPMGKGEEYAVSKETFDWVDLGVNTLVAFYIIGVAVCLSRVVVGLYKLWRMSVIYPRQSLGDLIVVRLPDPIAPFSFLHYVFVHEDMVGSSEFEQILAHERVHIQQRHSFDLIFVQVLASFLWFNPLIWRLIKSLKATHEYIADEKIMNSGYSLVEYQTMLLSQLISNNSNGLVHNFNLSFIKKRIAMMKNNKSGWSGKIKVAMTILATVISSVIFIQCNSGIDEQVSEATSVGTEVEGLTDEVNLPVLPATKYKFNGGTDVLNLSVSNDKIAVNGKYYQLEEVKGAVEKANLPHEAVIIARIDKDQKMGFVRDVIWELRRADKRKLLFLGQTKEGEKVEVAMMLPPTPENVIKFNYVPFPDAEEMIASGRVDPLRVNFGESREYNMKQKVYDFVMEHVKKNSSDYLVLAKYDDEDLYIDYLNNFLMTQEAFRQIYQTKAQEVFGKDYYDMGKEEFAKVRKSIPMSIFVDDENG